MKLTIGERIKISTILPAKPKSFLQKAIADDITKKLGFTRDEIKASDIEVATEGESAGNWSWNPEKDEPKDFDFDEDENNLLKERIKWAETEDGVDTWLFRLAEKFGIFRGRES
jgi:hypothetical protein